MAIAPARGRVRNRPDLALSPRAQRQYGLSKGEVGAAMSAVLMFFNALGGVVGPPVGAALAQSLGFRGFCVVFAIFLAAVYTPCAIYLYPFSTPGAWFQRA